MVRSTFSITALETTVLDPLAKTFATFPLQGCQRQAPQVLRLLETLKAPVMLHMLSHILASRL